MAFGWERRTHQEQHQGKLSLGDRIADHISDFIGSWSFVIGQLALFLVWGIINTLVLFKAIRFDPYPFIFMNLFMSAEAAFSTPLIIMSTNRQEERDRHQALEDFATNTRAEGKIDEILEKLNG